jgi:hypothetical protein
MLSCFYDTRRNVNATRCENQDEGLIFAHYQVDLPAPSPVIALDECVTVLDQVAQSEVLTPCPGGFVFQAPAPA